MNMVNTLQRIQSKVPAIPCKENYFDVAILIFDPLSMNWSIWAYYP